MPRLILYSIISLSKFSSGSWLPSGHRGREPLRRRLDPEARTSPRMDPSRDQAFHCLREISISRVACGCYCYLLSPRNLSYHTMLAWHIAGSQEEQYIPGDFDFPVQPTYGTARRSLQNVSRAMTVYCKCRDQESVKQQSMAVEGGRYADAQLLKWY